MARPLRLALPLLATLLAVALSGPPPAARAQVRAEEQAYKQAMEHFRAGRYEAALPHFRKVLAQAEARYGADSPMLALEFNNLAEIHRLSGRPKEAEPLYKRAIELDERAGEDNPGLATSLNNLAMLYRSQDRLEEAEPLYRRSLALLERALGPEHPDVAKGLNNLAVLYRMQGAGAKARPLQERALATAAKALGPEHPTTLTLRRNLDQVPVAPAAGPAAATVTAGPAATEPGPGASGKAPTRAAKFPAAATGARPPVPSVRPTAPRTSATDPRQAAVAAVATAPAPVAPSPATRPAAATGRFALHVASLPSAAAVPGEWRRLSSRHPSLKALPVRPPQAVEVVGKGIAYRVAGGAFATRAEAAAACERLRAAGQFCSVVAP